MPIWGKNKNQEAQPEQETVKKEGVPSKGNDVTVDKRTELEKRIIEKECRTEIQQLEVLKRMRKDSSWKMSVETLLLCENNPSDAELIATSINSKRVKIFSRFKREPYRGNQKPAMDDSYQGSSEDTADEELEPR